MDTLEEACDGYIDISRESGLGRAGLPVTH